MKLKRKCDTLRIAYNTLLEENQDLAQTVIDNANKYEALETEKETLENKVEEKQEEVDKSKNKRFSFGFSVGAIPVVRNEKVTVGASVMVGLHYKVFSF